MTNNNISVIGNQCQSQVGSFCEILEKLRQCLEINCFSAKVKPQAEELCLIIAEVYKLPPDTQIQIAGAKLPAEMVQEIYKNISHDHIELVIDNFQKVGYIINHKKTYLRTALYNSVFEIEAHYTNQVKHTGY